MIDRYYPQKPFVLHLPTQFTLLWLLVVGAVYSTTDASLTQFVGGALAIGAVGGAIRWLPDSALQSGMPKHATALVKSNLPMRPPAAQLLPTAALSNPMEFA